MSQHPIIELVEAVASGPFKFKEPVSLRLEKGENWIIYGPNGSGKTTLSDMLRSLNKLSAGQVVYHFQNNLTQRASDNISYVTFFDQYNGSVLTGATAYQMRWNQGVMDEEFEPRVKDMLKRLGNLPSAFRDKMMKQLRLDDMLERTIISLSSGEFRRFQLMQIVAKQPTVLIIDNPFIGLDDEGCQTVWQMFKEITEQLDITLILILSRLPKDIEGFTHIIDTSESAITKRKAENFRNLLSKQSDFKITARASVSNEIVMEARNLNIRYGERTILKDFSLQIRQGERWAIKGPNGSGKSTLLSLICADNPQGYASDITLFGRRRGTGESIWDIKRNIGFVSPEMYRSYRRNLKVKEIVASGLFDTNGLFHKPKQEDFQQIKKWLELFGIQDWAERSYLTLSSGEQRLALLCRAFVKNPPLLILDEPFQGLDDHYRDLSKNIIAQYCTDCKKTLLMVSHDNNDFPQETTNLLQIPRIK